MSCAISAIDMAPLLKIREGMDVMPPSSQPGRPDGSGGGRRAGHRRFAAEDPGTRVAARADRRLGGRGAGHHPARADLGAADRPDDAGDVGDGSAAREQERRARDRDRAHDRLRHGRERGRGDEAGRLRLRHQADQARAPGARRRQGAGEALAGAGEPVAARPAGRREAPHADRPVAALAADDGDRHAGGAVDGQRAPAGRIGDRQGAARPRDSRATRRARPGPSCP